MFPASEKGRHADRPPGMGESTGETRLTTQPGRHQPGASGVNVDLPHCVEMPPKCATASNGILSHVSNLAQVQKLVAHSGHDKVRPPKAVVEKDGQVATLIRQNALGFALACRTMPHLSCCASINGSCCLAFAKKASSGGTAAMILATVILLVATSLSAKSMKQSYLYRKSCSCQI